MLEVHQKIKSYVVEVVLCLQKIKSYVVEAYFYEHLAPQLGAADIHLSATRHTACHLDAHGGTMQLLLTDLREHFPRSVSGPVTVEQAKVVLTWLARLHAHFWQQELPAEVWPQGTYWHLATRQQELESMGPAWAALKAAAAAIDRRLQQPDDSGRKRWRTLVHGDAKLENILWNDSLSDCAFYDFQYTGMVPVLSFCVSLSVFRCGRSALLTQPSRPITPQVAGWARATWPISWYRQCAPATWSSTLRSCCGTGTPS